MLYSHLKNYSFSCVSKSGYARQISIAQNSLLILVFGIYEVAPARALLALQRAQAAWHPWVCSLENLAAMAPPGNLQSSQLYSLDSLC